MCDHFFTPLLHIGFDHYLIVYNPIIRNGFRKYSSFVFISEEKFKSIWACRNAPLPHSHFHLIFFRNFRFHAHSQCSIFIGSQFDSENGKCYHFSLSLHFVFLAFDRTFTLLKYFTSIAFQILLHELCFFFCDLQFLFLFACCFLLSLSLFHCLHSANAIINNIA